MVSVTDVAVRPCVHCNETGELLAGFRTVTCAVCSGRGFLYVDCFLCRDTMLLGGIPCECAEVPA